jgi:hypothetical protein
MKISGNHLFKIQAIFRNLKRSKLLFINYNNYKNWQIKNKKKFFYISSQKTDKLIVL